MTPFDDDEARMLPFDGGNLCGTPNPFTGQLGWTAWKELVIGGRDTKGFGSAEIFVNGKSVGCMMDGLCNFDRVTVKPNDLIQLGALSS